LPTGVESGAGAADADGDGDTEGEAVGEASAVAVGEEVVAPLGLEVGPGFAPPRTALRMKPVRARRATTATPTITQVRRRDVRSGVAGSSSVTMSSQSE
jgi:hypothetical protein